MNLQKTRAVMSKEARHILRDPATLALLLLAPVLLMVITAYSLAVDIEKTPVTVIDNSRSPLSRQFLNSLGSSQAIVVTGVATGYTQGEQLFDRGLTKGLLVIPADFSSQLTAGQTVEVQLLVDGTDPTTADHVINHVVSRSQVFGREALDRAEQSGALEQPAGSPRFPSIDLKTRIWYNPSLENSHGVVPALIPVVLSLPAIVVMTAIVREKESGTLETIFATPLSRSELLVGKILPYIVTGLISSIACVLVAVHLFGTPFRGSFFLFLLLTVDFFLAAFSIGLLIATFLSSQAASAILGLLFFLLPGFFLTGIFYPVSNFPELVQEEIKLLPGTHFVTIARGLMVKGQGLDALWPPALMLLGLAISALGLALFFFEKKVR